MKSLVIFIITTFVCQFGLKAQTLSSANAKSINNRLESSDTLYVIHFWATWCGPCVKELPEFELLATLTKDLPVKILLVSLDFKESYPNKILHFIKKKKITNEVVWLDETNANEFIPQLEKEWQGSIPATIVKLRKNGYHNFWEGEIKANQLFLIIQKQLQ